MPTIINANKAPTEYCPIIGGNVMPSLDQPPVIQGGAPQLAFDWKLLGCISEKCVFWNKEKSGCSIKLAAETFIKIGDLVEANKGKLSIMSMLSGGKK